MISRLAALALSPVARAFIRKLAGVFVVSFVSAAGGIWARRVHRDDYKPRPTWSQQRRKRP